MSLWSERSLTARTTIVFALIACMVIGALGSYVYISLKMSMESQTAFLVDGRADYFSDLVRSMYTVDEMKERPLLFCKMLGAEQNVLIIRQPHKPPYIEVNPSKIPVPDLPAKGVNETSFTTVWRHGADDIPVRWSIVKTATKENNGLVEIVVGHPMDRETKILSEHKIRTFEATLIGMAAATLLSYIVLMRGLRPVRDIASRAVEINPGSLSVRLDSRAAPAELRQMTTAINAMLDRISDGYGRLSQFSADLAHEIRTPIGILIGETQVALNQPRTVEEYQQLLDSNLVELNHLRHIAGNILFLSQAEHSSFSIGREQVTLKDTLLKIADYFEGVADERNMRFTVEAEGMVSANPDLCRRAINNLVVNAVRYGAAGTTVRLVGSEDANGASVVVENVGLPVPPDQLKKLFDRFYRADSARTGFTESNGLGLAIVRTIMHLHSGIAEVHCPLPGLIRFELRFPKI